MAILTFKDSQENASSSEKLQIVLTLKDENCSDFQRWKLFSLWRTKIDKLAVPSSRENINWHFCFIVLEFTQNQNQVPVKECFWRLKKAPSSYCIKSLSKTFQALSRWERWVVFAPDLLPCKCWLVVCFFLHITTLRVGPRSQEHIISWTKFSSFAVNVLWVCVRPISLTVYPALNIWTSVASYHPHWYLRTKAKTTAAEVWN